MKHTVGIDPGQTGGLVALDASGRVVEALRMPTGRHGNGHPTVSGEGVAAFLRKWDPVLIVIEDVYSSPQMGVVGAFTFGQGKGVLLGVLGALGMADRVKWPSPIEWKGRMGLLLPPDGRTKAQRRKALKALAIARAKKLFPGVAGMGHDGVAEAGLLAAYGLLVYRP